MFGLGGPYISGVQMFCDIYSAIDNTVESGY